jgi:hypothetical protein
MKLNDKTMISLPRENYLEAYIFEYLIISYNIIIYNYIYNYHQIL